jgi:hypothetical protein
VTEPFRTTEMDTFPSPLHFSARLRQQALNALLQAAWMRADHTPNRPSTREQDERWNALDAQLGRYQHVLVSIHLHETQLFLIGIAQPRKERGQHAAGRAPVRREIDDHRERGVEHALLKILVTHQKQIGMIFYHSFLSFSLGKTFRVSILPGEP